MWAEVSEVLLIGNACGGNTNVHGINGAWPRFHNVAQKLNAFGAGAVEDAAFAPPENIVIIAIGFTMAHITTACKPAPKTFGEFFTSDIAPPLTTPRHKISCLLALLVHELRYYFIY